MPFRWSCRTTQTVAAAALNAPLSAHALKQFREPARFEIRHWP